MIIINRKMFQNNFRQKNRIINSWVFRYGKPKFVQPNFILITSSINMSEFAKHGPVRKKLQQN